MHPDERYSPMSPEVEYEDKFAPVEAAQQRLRDTGAMQPASGRAEMHYTLKRPRQNYDEENLPPPVAQQRLEGRGAVPLASGRAGDIKCRHFNSPAGCLYGDSCRFRHVPKDVSQGAEHPGLSFGGKLKPCMNFFSTSGCPYDGSCHFQHYRPGGPHSMALAPAVSSTAGATPEKKPAIPSGAPSIAVNYYKTRLCNWFNTPGGCLSGDLCNFAHGEQDLRPPTSAPRRNWGPVGDGPLRAVPPAPMWAAPSGDLCHFAHGLHDLRPPTNAPRGSWRPVAVGDGPIRADLLAPTRAAPALKATPPNLNPNTISGRPNFRSGNPSFFNGNSNFNNTNSNFSNPSHPAPPGSVPCPNYQSYGGPQAPSKTGTSDVSGQWK